MSIIETVRGRASPKALLPAEVQKELASAQAQLADLEGQHGAAALDAMAHEPGAEGRLEDLNRKVVGARERVHTLTGALRVAREREEASILAQRAALQAAQRKAAIQHLRARDDAAVALGGLLEEAAKQYRTLLDRSEKAQAACPILTQWPDGSLCNFADIQRLVVGEMYRVSATSGTDDWKLPGAREPHLNYQWNPQAIPKLGDQMKTASAFVIGKLTGKASG